MIRKLRRKFVLTNMLLVSLVLLVVFGALVVSNYQRLADQSRTAMRAALLWSDEGPDRFEFGASGLLDAPEEGDEKMASRISMVPVFTVTLDENGKPAEVMGGGNVSVSDETVEQAVAQAQGEEGVIPELDLRYLRETTPDGETRIAFADRGWERSTLWSMVGSFLLVGALALGAFFVISLLLSSLALRPAERAWEQQRRFVADASHELKTPLTVILTNTGILLSHPEDTVAEQRKWVEYIRDEAQRMRELVEDLLFLARHDAGREPPPDQTVDLSELLWSALLPFEPVAFEQGVELESGIQGGLTVRGREDQLRRLAAILLDNAVKYAGAQGKVRVALTRGEKGGACLTVRNTGPAIPPEHLEHLFERFYRADDSRARSSGGYGLGLAIAKSIVDSHRGTITVQSGAEEGTLFTARLRGKDRKNPPWRWKRRPGRIFFRTAGTSHGDDIHAGLLQQGLSLPAQVLVGDDGMDGGEGEAGGHGIGPHLVGGGQDDHLPGRLHHGPGHLGPEEVDGGDSLLSADGVGADKALVHRELGQPQLGEGTHVGLGVVLEGAA